MKLIFARPPLPGGGRGQITRNPVRQQVTAELFRSLQLSPEARTTGPDEWCRRRAYLGVLRAITFRERSKGLAVEQISRCWKVEPLPGIEEAWRNNRTTEQILSVLKHYLIWRSAPLAACAVQSSGDSSGKTFILPIS
jgi:hypothetical protein